MPHNHRHMKIPPQAKGPLQAALVQAEPGRTLKGCVLVDDRGELYACFDDEFPVLDMNSGESSVTSSVKFTSNPSCWEYICTRYGCFWIPVPC